MPVFFFLFGFCVCAARAHEKGDRVSVNFLVLWKKRSECERNLPWAFGEEEEEDVNKFKREVARREPCLPATRPSSLSRLPRFSFFSSLVLMDFLYAFFLDSPSFVL